MSADNFVGVRPNPDELTYSVFEYGCMSILDEDCMYLHDEKGEEITGVTMEECRSKALIRAHDIVKDMYICEYGVVEMPAVPDQPCGRCFICVYMRGIVDGTLEKCDKCNKPISTGEWMESSWDSEKGRIITKHISCRQ